MAASAEAGSRFTLGSAISPIAARMRRRTSAGVRTIPAFVLISALSERSSASATRHVAHFAKCSSAARSSRGDNSPSACAETYLLMYSRQSNLLYRRSLTSTLTACGKLSRLRPSLGTARRPLSCSIARPCGCQEPVFTRARSKSCSAVRINARPRDTRDLTVPNGTPRTSATSW